ncbi:hypothetical protein J6590_046456 [Homalodisca vitripennis]|nr:hypothetical protein J6590_046456 [Homalodisca vitripennis]
MKVHAFLVQLKGKRASRSTHPPEARILSCLSDTAARHPSPLVSSQSHQGHPASNGVVRVVHVPSGTLASPGVKRMHEKVAVDNRPVSTILEYKFKAMPVRHRPAVKVYCTGVQEELIVL